MNIQYGTILDFKYEPLGNGKKLLVKVNVDDRVTHWLPVKTPASSFLIEHTPVRNGDQVIVHNPFGDNKDGFVDRNITYESIPLPNNINENKFYKEFEDGTTFIHDTKEKTITLDTKCNISITTTATVDLKAKTVNVDSKDINLGLGGAGVVTAECICKLDGKPHIDFSTTVKATK